MLKRVVWRDKYEIIFVGPNQVLLKPLHSQQEEITVLSEYGAEIDDVKILGRDNYLVARTNASLIVADLQRRLISEVTINGIKSTYSAKIIAFIRSHGTILDARKNSILTTQTCVWFSMQVNYP